MDLDQLLHLEPTYLQPWEDTLTRIHPQFLDISDRGPVNCGKLLMTVRIPLYRHHRTTGGCVAHRHFLCTAIDDFGVEIRHIESCLPTVLCVLVRMEIALRSILVKSTIGIKPASTMCRLYDRLDEIDDLTREATCLGLLVVKIWIGRLGREMLPLVQFMWLCRNKIPRTSVFVLDNLMLLLNPQMELQVRPRRSEGWRS